MSFRRTTIHLLIGTVLLCPFSCLNKAAGGSTCVQEATCDSPDCCCPLPQKGPTPCPPKEGGDCLCHGAVMEHATQVPALELQPMSACGLDDAPEMESTTVLGVLNLQPSACDFAVADSGRTILRRDRVASNLSDVLSLWPLLGSRPPPRSVCESQPSGQYCVVHATLASG